MMEFLNKGRRGEEGKPGLYFAEHLAIFPKLCWLVAGGRGGAVQGRKEMLLSIVPLECPPSDLL